MTRMLLVALVFACTGFAKAQGEELAVDVRGARIVVPVPPGMNSYPVSRAMARPDLVVPANNELVAMFVPLGSRDMREAYHMLVQVHRKDVTTTAAQLATLAEQVRSSGARPDLMKRSQEAFKEKQSDLKGLARDPTATVKPLGMAVQDYVYRKPRTQSMRALLTASLTSKGREYVLTRPAYVTIVQLPASKLAFSYFYGEWESSPHARDEFIRSWLARFESSNRLP